ncbi:uncharacterized protein NECHADRAFT_74541 [Fusarium vanettenii 77-13-4]|uniref:BAH domain-containing protein n=1 Tax=Fusarium vanettenii (strain ATCC MYA-4622 / CBS 123669 / FGSC 9596 / NRRL 45880 / 77-13-4) TaxID=660122 RepID=C7YKA6_FUSV7|nr:uncharacterized protein NECHADRAFT_74541 [Fusarium vanettenii 77-13-4]EEU48417.1 hypothetical protein NECHADRAFT_74541 [Fusarium vanettenii 77-13-4]
MSNRKRSRSIAEENRAECPFTIGYANGPSRAEQERHKNKKRKRGEGQDDDKRVQIQISPFSPTGSFKTHDTMDLYYTVEPSKRWQDMTRYNSFVLNGIKYYSEGFVFVANEATIERQRAAGTLGSVGPLKKSDDDWVARILEIRAADEHHVYARVYWMYWPDELPSGTLDGKKTVQGRQPYHGQNELIASNHMDVINVVSVTQPATVNQWIESDDEEIQDALYWRQAYDCRNSQLSSVDLMCKCQTPANPDKTLIGCTSSECGKWMHRECLSHDVLMQVFERLGTTKPHRTEGTIVKEEKSSEEATRPLSPTDAEEKETQPTIDVRSGETQDNVHVKKGTRETPRNTDTPTPGPTPSRTVTASAKGSAKKGRKKKTMDLKPYQGLFEATLKMNEGPTVWEIRDLRENVTGGEKSWTEKAHCLMCGVVID